MPLDLMTLSFLERPVNKREGMEILKRDQYRCQYCGLDGSASFENALAMSVDFVIPRARKGKKDPSNLVACCRPCNMIKGTRIYRSFDEAKEYVLKRRKQLRQAWEKTTNQRPAQGAAAGEESSRKTHPEKSKTAAGSVISRSPLSLRQP
jgi:hypothetical protein